MVIDLDHIAYATDDIAGLKTQFFQEGYKEVFHLDSVTNCEAKRPYMSAFCTHHQLALLKKYGSFPFELIQYEHLRSGSGRQTLFPFSDELINSASHEPDFFSHLFKSRGSIYAGPGHPASDLLFLKYGSCTALAVRVFQFQKSCGFWSDLGLSTMFLNEELCGFRLLSLASSMEYHFYLVPGSDKGETMLDDPGFNCVALLCSDVHRDVARLSQRGYTTTVVTKIGTKRNFFAAFVQGPSGEIVELLSLA